ncbi:MAG: methylenetetrahydrofolate--tRNA-(uracil(54)-C(5))-methyltransferase (FADH(2)-oxidizing) TrmFO, partial [Armatimonadetes bacterium]|nr:methylenetetrahydrofolate--tRNA-(uracil(54)-C(5))-methyltransferase (FADH(2)-oxidizing) TrmFO [Candidatus Hippobium faecium]
MVNVIGGGLAGCEAAYALACAGHKTALYEMRPKKNTEAHKTGYLGELVCSSSLKSEDVEAAHGLLKSEMRAFGSLILEAGEAARVPGGGALCVDKELFGKYITDKIYSHPNITVINEEIKDFPEGYVIVATGPLTSSSFANFLMGELSSEKLFFFDAIAPSVMEDSIDYSKVFRQSRYDKGDADYINCPFTQEEYYNFMRELLNAKKTDLHLECEKAVYYEGCLPVEVMAGRGLETLTYGMMKPRGLTNPHTGSRPYAVVQLRQENKEGSVYGLVGFQTQLTVGEQKRVFRMIPGLENCEFTRFGEVHRNTYIKSPDFLNEFLQYRKDPRIFFAGQLIGVEGYMESASMGIVAGHNMARLIEGREMLKFPRFTM